MTEEIGIWTHALVRDVRAEQLAGIDGVGGRPVRAVEHAGLTAVVSPVDLEEFGEGPLRRNLENLAWLEKIARAHHAVVDALARLGPVAPVRLATVYRGDAALREVLARHRDGFSAALDRVTGRVEWGVKAYATPVEPGKDADAGPSAGPGGNDAGGNGAGGAGRGAAYLRRRRAQLSAREEGLQAALRSAEAIHTVLSQRAEAAQLHAPQDPKLSGEEGAMVLNGAYLIGQDRADAFAESVRDLADRHSGVRLQLTGPWPAYSFAVVEADAGPATAGDGAR